MDINLPSELMTGMEMVVARPDAKATAMWPRGFVLRATDCSRTVVSGRLIEEYQNQFTGNDNFDVMKVYCC